MVRYHITVFGDVQGVGFRYFVLKNASIYDINGWVRNKLDYTVEIDAEGTEMNLNEFISIVKQGSQFSLVEAVDIIKMSNRENYKTFEIIDDE